MPLDLVLATSASELRVNVAAEQEMRLRFNHSIYGSVVEEAFAVCAHGFETRQLRYEEPCLAEYYGHDHAVRCGKWWVVEVEPRTLPEIVLRVTPQSRMRLSVVTVALDLAEIAGSDGSIRASIERGGET
jgi:hypothetical protein